MTTASFTTVFRRSTKPVMENHRWSALPGLSRSSEGASFDGARWKPAWAGAGAPPARRARPGKPGLAHEVGPGCLRLRAQARDGIRDGGEELAELLSDAGGPEREDHHPGQEGGGGGHVLAEGDLPLPPRLTEPLRGRLLGLLSHGAARRGATRGRPGRPRGTSWRGRRARGRRRGGRARVSRPAP